MRELLNDAIKMPGMALCSTTAPQRNRISFEFHAASALASPTIDAYMLTRQMKNQWQNHEVFGSAEGQIMKGCGKFKASIDLPQHFTENTKRSSNGVCRQKSQHCWTRCGVFS
jgi:hypothetical protein